MPFWPLRATLLQCGMAFTLSFPSLGLRKEHCDQSSTIIEVRDAGEFPMKKLFPLVVICLFGSIAFAQQSLGDIAREERAKKRAGSPAVRLDDDTTHRTVSAEPAAKSDDKSVDAKAADDKSADAKPADDKSADAKSGDAKSADAKAADAKEAAKKDSAETQKQKNEDLKKQIDAQKQEIVLLQRELDVAQREGRLRAAAYYADAGTMLRDQTKFAEDSRKEQAEIDTKKQALEAKQQKLADLQEEARKAGLPPSVAQ